MHIKKEYLSWEIYLLYVGDDSADVYEYRKCFQLDDKFYPKFVSGASPDYFSKDGQLWDILYMIGII